MRINAKEELNEILRKHALWLCGANLSGANLSEADLSGANLSEANLSEADLSGANLSEADLSGANLTEADLSEANLSGANLTGAKLYEADLSGAKLYEADLRWANLDGVKNLSLPITCPEEGFFIGFKKCRNDLIVKLEIPADALRCSAIGRKCRCSKAKVLSITNVDGSDANTDTAASKHDKNFIYKIGETVEVPNFDTNRWNECSAGIHFFITRQEAVEYGY